MIREEIRKFIKEAFEIEFPGSSFDGLAFYIDKPPRKEFGDYSASFYRKVDGGIYKRKFEEVEYIRIVNHIKENSRFREFFENVEFFPIVFINFFLSKEYLQKQVGKILKQKDKFGELKLGKGQKVQVEFISANPTGPLTVGNARGGPFGDVLANVFKKAGFKTEKAYYINDYGMQILTLGHSVLKDNEAKYKGKYIDYLNKKIKEKHPYKAGEKAAKIIIKEMIKKTTDRMGIEYDEWFSENALHNSNQVDKTTEFLKKKSLIYKKEGALWFKSTKFGDMRDRVLVKKDGKKTYLAGDIAYHRYKFEKKKFDKVIDVWGADHAGDVSGLKFAVEALGHKGKLDIILLQFVTLFEKKEKLKMSKRSGIYVTMDELLNKVPLDAVRFFFLQKSSNTHLNFDLNLAKGQSEKNPVYYVQYAYARICSILRKCGKSKFPISNFQTNSKFQILNSKLNLLNHSSELNLIKQLIRFPEIIEDMVKDYQVQRIPQYALDLATVFHQFYRDCRVLAENSSLSEARLSLILATKIVLKNNLDLMGISAPEKM